MSPTADRFCRNMHRIKNGPHPRESNITDELSCTEIPKDFASPYFVPSRKIGKEARERTVAKLYKPRE